MEVSQELIEKAIRQAIANVSLEDDMVILVDEEEIIKDKVLVLEGNRHGRMGRLYYRWY